MKICFLVEDIFLIGGVSRVVTTLANEMVINNEVTVICISENINIDYSLYNLNKNINVYAPLVIRDKKRKYIINRCMRYINKNKVKIKSNKLLDWTYLPKKLTNKYINYFREADYDVIIAVQGRTSLILGRIAPYVNSKCIGWQHSSFEAYFETPNQYYWNQLSLFLKYIKQLDCYVVLTNSDQRKFIEMGLSNCIRIYNPISNDDIRVNNLKKEYDLLFVGRLSKESKGLDFLLDIIKMVHDKNKRVKVAIVGDGNGYKYLKSQIDILHLNNTITLVGETNNVDEFYSSSKVLLSTSRWEGFGLVLLESMKYGVPIISFANTGPFEILGGSNAGILIEKYDIIRFSEQVISLLENTTKLNLMCNCAKKRVKDFYVDKIIGEWYGIMQE